MNHRENYKENIPSVTELLKWAGYYKQYPNDEYYLARGHFVEEMATSYLMGCTPDDRMMGTAYIGHAMPSGGLEQWMSYIDPFREWMGSHKIKIRFIASQKYVYSWSDTFQGTLDWLLEIDGHLTVVDCKTGTCPPFVALQTAGYAIGLNTAKPLKRLGLQLEPGKCTEHWYKNHKDYDAFRILARCWHMHGPQSKEYR